MSGRVCDKKKTNQSTVTLQSRTSSTWGWCMVTQAAEHYLPNLRCIGLSWSSRFIVLSLVHHWAELWGILGNKIPIPSPALFESNKLPSLSQQAEDTETKKNWTLRLLIIPSSCVHTVCGVHCYKKKRNKNNPRYSHEHVNIFAPVFLMLLYVLQNLYPYL